MNYNIISTGSKGNCVIINNVMVDCGVPFKNVKEYLYDVKYLLLTHIHTDHIRETTLNNIKKMFPRIHIIGNYQVHQHFNVHTIANANYPIETDDYIFTPFECVHDVVTYGYTWEHEGLKIIYATDTSTLEHAPKEKYDYFFIESNHDENKIELLRKGIINVGYNAYAGAKRHLSSQKAKSFFYSNRRDANSKLIELHMSERFY